MRFDEQNPLIQCLLFVKLQIVSLWEYCCCFTQSTISEKTPGCKSAGAVQKEREEASPASEEQARELSCQETCEAPFELGYSKRLNIFPLI